MNDELQITKTSGRNPTLAQPELEPVTEKNNKPDAKSLRVEHVGKLLESAYQHASALKLKNGEAKRLREDFAHESIELRPHDGIIYISHMALRERLWDVFGPGAVAEICRDRFMRIDSNEIAVDLVLLIRGTFVAEAIGTAKYYANNANMGYGDCVEAAWSDALRRCCKKFGVGTQVWRPGYIREWKEKYAVEFKGKWHRKTISTDSGVTEKEAVAKSERDSDPALSRAGAGKRVTATQEADEDAVPF